MNINDIIPGNLYVVETSITGKYLLGVIVNARSPYEADINEFPFEISSAKFKISAKEVIKPVK